MNTSDKIGLAVRNFCELLKDNIKQKLAQEISAKKMALSPEHVALLLHTASAVVDQTFHAAVSSITSMVPADKPAPGFNMKKPTKKT